jgi:hypothetical protein
MHLPLCKSLEPLLLQSPHQKNCNVFWGCVGIITHAIHNWNSLSKLGVPPCAALQLIAQVTT